MELILYLWMTLIPYDQLMLGYIDPGTGSIILQAVVGAIAGIAIAVRLFWYRILKLFGIKKHQALDEEEDK